MSLCACSKDDENGANEKNGLVGTWEVYKVVCEYGRYTEIDDEYGEGSGYRDIYEFRDGGIGENKYMEYNYGRWVTDYYPFTYKLDGSTLRMTSGGESQIMTIEKLTTSELIWMEQYRDDDDYEIYRTYLKRI